MKHSPKMNRKTLSAYTIILISLFLITSCSESNETDSSTKNSTEIQFARTVTSDYNPDVNGIDTVSILKDGNLIKESNFYDPEFYISKLKEGIKNHYYVDWYDGTKCFYSMIDTTHYQIEHSVDTKEILGYKCVKTTFTSNRDTITAYITNDLNVNFAYAPYLKIKGCILELSIKDKWSTEFWKAIKIDSNSKKTIELPTDHIDDESAAYKEKIAGRNSKEAFRSTPLQSGDPAPNFTALSLSNEKIDLDNLKGKVVILNFWFIACTGCVAEMPELNRLVNEFGEENVEFISITSDSRNALYKFLRRKEFDFKILPYSGIVANRYAVTGYPTTIVIDKKGIISQAYYFQMVEPHIGYDNLVNVIKKELKK